MRKSIGTALPLALVLVTAPTAAQTGATQPGSTQPGTTQPGTTQPGTTHGAAGHAGMTQPGTSGPAASAVGSTGSSQPASGTVAAWIAGSANHSTLAQAIAAADLNATLSGGDFTVFAPDNSAFQALPAGTLEGLLQPQNRATLTQILTFHVVPQRVSYEQIEAAMEANGGTASYTTVNGQQIRISREGQSLQVAAQGGSVGFVGRYDLEASDGVVHSINAVLVPALQAPPAAAAPAAPGTTAPAQPGAATTPAEPGAMTAPTRPSTDPAATPGD